MTKYLVKYNHTNDSIPSHLTSSPRLIQDLCHRYLIEDHVVLTNLPMAPHRYMCGRAAISVRDCITDMLGRGVPIELYGTWQNPSTGSIVNMVWRC
jgi:hypothetical protein